MTVLIDRCCDILVENLTIKAESNDDFELRDFCGSFTLDVISSTAFGLETDAQKYPDEPFVTHGKDFFHFPPMSVILALFAPFAFPWLPTFVKKNLYDHVNFYEALCHKVIKERQANKKDYNDFLQLMLAHLIDDKEIKESPTGWSPKGLSFTEIQAQALTFLTAGLETTAITLALTLYQLAIHPDILEKAIAEVDEKLGQSKLDYEKASELTYIEMCINETLRLYPPARFDRVANCDVTIGEVNIKKGMIVTFPIYAMQRDPDIWEEPERYDPERFSPANKSSIGPYDFMPFGYGPRICMGMRLSQLEMKIAISRILQQFKPILCGKSQVPLSFEKLGLVLKAEKGMWVKIESRHGHSSCRFLPGHAHIIAGGKPDLPENYTLGGQLWTTATGNQQRYHIVATNV